MGDINKKIAAVVLGAGVLGAGPACAIEGNGLPIYPDGLENFMSGALPPPGVHLLMYGGAMRYDSVRDKNGDKLPIPDFKVDVAMVAPRLVWVTDQQVFGGQLAFHALAPLLTVKAQAAGQSQRRSGLGDVVFGPALGFHPSEKMHSQDVVHLGSGLCCPDWPLQSDRQRQPGPQLLGHSARCCVQLHAAQRHQPGFEDDGGLQLPQQRHRNAYG